MTQDGDGLNDGIEVTGTGTQPLNPDSDSDGLSDGDEVNTHGTDPFVQDTDGDGFSDLAEVNAGTNPLDNSDNPNSNLTTIQHDFEVRVTLIRDDNGSFPGIAVNDIATGSFEFFDVIDSDSRADVGFYVPQPAGANINLTVKGHQFATEVSQSGAIDVVFTDNFAGYPDPNSGSQDSYYLNSLINVSSNSNVSIDLFELGMTDTFGNAHSSDSIFYSAPILSNYNYNKGVHIVADGGAFELVAEFISVGDVADTDSDGLPDSWEDANGLG